MSCKFTFAPITSNILTVFKDEVELEYGEANISEVCPQLFCKFTSAPASSNILTVFS